MAYRPLSNYFVWEDLRWYTVKMPSKEAKFISGINCVLMLFGSKSVMEI